MPLIFEDLFSAKLSSESACRAHKGSTEPGVVLKYAQSTETWHTSISCQSLFPKGETCCFGNISDHLGVGKGS